MTKPIFTIPEDVAAFLDKAVAAYQRAKADEFNQFMLDMCSEIESPIEQLFMVAINLVAEVNHIPVSVGGGSKFPDDDGHLIVIPQFQAGKYRADFALRQRPFDKIVCVELDGHAFHDRDERQRRYEKMRDRFFTAQGYGVLHFTGSEIVKDPCAAALEAFNIATGLGDVAVNPLKDG